MYTLSALELNKKIRSGEISAEQVVKHFLDRIEKFDKDLGAFLRIFPQKSLEKAREIDKKRARGQLGRLAGIPIAIKDNIHIKGEISSCASKFLTNYKAPFDATVTRLLEAEDAILIGKTNMDEFAMGSSTENSALQKTSNPWDLKCTPGGSSGGSAAAVAARLVPLALGTDTGGSIRQPASFCGVVGFKPTYGRVSRYGLVAFGSSLDQIGPLTNYTEDTALLMSVLGSPCEKDSTSLPDPTEDYSSFLKTDFKGVKIGVPWQFLESLAESPKKSFLHGLDIMKNLGAEIVEVDLAILKYAIATYYILATAEASTNLARFDGVRYGVRSPHAKTLNEVYDFSKEEGFGKEVKRRILLGTFVLSAGYQDAYYRKAQRVRALILQKYQEAFQKCDLIITPTSPFDAFEMGSIHDPLQMYLEDIYTIGINLAGLPAISVPNGLSSNGKPLGIQLIGPQRHDRDVLACAHAFETVAKGYELMPKFGA